MMNLHKSFVLGLVLSNERNRGAANQKQELSMVAMLLERYILNTQTIFLSTNKSFGLQRRGLLKFQPIRTKNRPSSHVFFAGSATSVEDLTNIIPAKSSPNWPRGENQNVKCQ
jgi:hypothetical protein